MTEALDIIIHTAEESHRAAVAAHALCKRLVSDGRRARLVAQADEDDRNGRKMARKDRDALRAAIATFLDGVNPPAKDGGKPVTEYGQCETCGMFNSAAKALHDARKQCEG